LTFLSKAFGFRNGYAMMWWTYDRGSLSAERYPAANRQAILQARGTGGQALFIIPEAKMVIVHRTDTDRGKSVPGREIWTVVDRILGARTDTVCDASRTTALRAEPFSNPLPAMEWPEPVTLAPGALGKLTGNYVLAPGISARVFLHEGRLASMPGEGEAELFARSPSDFLPPSRPDRDRPVRAGRERARIGRGGDLTRPHNDGTPH